MLKVSENIMTKIKYILIFSLFIILCCNTAFARRSSRDKACFSNIRVIQGAIEMYNMDVSTMMEELNPKTMDILVKEKYLKAYPTPPETSKCEYQSIGDLTDAGIIFCKYHGDIEHLVYCDYYKDNFDENYEKFSQNASNEEIKRNIDRITKGREQQKMKRAILDYLPAVIAFITLALIIWASIPNKKRTNSQ